MRIAIIDLGTNSVRFDVHELREKKKPRLLHREKMMIRLGQNVFLKGKIDKQALARTLHAFRHFRRILSDLKVSKTVAFGTSALREASDAATLVERLRDDSGIDVKIISGNEEAKLIAQGILANEKIPSARFAIVDIGGGSTEIAICKGRKVLFGHSFPLGTARLQQVFLKKSPPSPDSIKRLRAYIRNILSQKISEEAWPKVKVIVGSSGTVKAAAKISKKKKSSISRRELEELLEKMSSMTTTQLLGVAGMEAKRVDMILAGMILLEEVAHCIGATTITPTDYSLRDGIIKEEMDVVKAHKSSRLELHMDELYAKAVRLGADELHLRDMVNFGEVLFRRTKNLHKLDRSWLAYFLAAVVLRKTGEIVGLSGCDRHSYYIVKNSDFPSMDEWEIEFVAKLCQFHISGKISSKDLEFLGKDKKKKSAFHKLLAILRVLDALDLGPLTSPVLKKAQIQNETVKLCFSGKATAGVESLLIDRKKQLFEEVFDRTLVLKLV